MTNLRDDLITLGNSKSALDKFSLPYFTFTGGVTFDEDDEATHDTERHIIYCDGDKAKKSITELDSKVLLECLERL